jgi:hypothetical protein
MIRSATDHPDFFAPTLHHEFCCSSLSALVAAYTSVSEAPWIESCFVDLPSLRLVLRLSAATRHPSKAMMEWLQRLERVTQELPSQP